MTMVFIGMIAAFKIVAYVIGCGRKEKAEFNRMNTQRYLTLVTAPAMLFAAIATAHAVPSLRLSDGITTVTIVDGGLGDSGALTGQVKWSGAVGIFNINVSTGLTDPILGTPAFPRIMLNSVNTSGGPGQLSVWFSDTDFSASADGAFQTIGGGTTSGTVSLSSYYDAGNTVFGQGTTLANFGGLTGALGGPSTTAVSSPLGADSSYSLTVLAQITHTAANQSSSFSLDLRRVSVPDGGASAILLGIGVLAAGVVRRKI